MNNFDEVNVKSSSTQKQSRSELIEEDKGT